MYLCNMKRICYSCKKEKELICFSKNKKEPLGLSYQCKDCMRNERIKRLYGITIDEYNILFIKQKGKCCICNKHQSEVTKRLNIDHCHTTGKIRGLLCNSCNQAIGAFKDNIETLKNAIKYLEENNC